MVTGQNNGNSKGIAIDFIDPLFAVVISVSFFEVMTRQWFTPNSINDLLSSAFDIFVLLLGYLTVVLSWVGYHRSIRGKPIRIKTLPGFWRFILDIVLLFCYWLLLVKFESFGFVLLILALIYWLYVFWDQLKWREHKKDYKPEERLTACRRRGVSTFWAIILTLVFVVNWLLPNTYDCLFLIMAYIAIILYRFHKNYLRPALVLDCLAFGQPETEKRT